MKQLAIMFSCVLRSKHLVACFGNRNDDEKKVFDDGRFLSTYSRSVTIIDSHQRQCNSRNAFRHVKATRNILLPTSHPNFVKPFVSLDRIIIINVIGCFDEWFLWRILVGPPLELIVLTSKS